MTLARLLALLPPDRREWGEALLAERAAVPPAERRAWLLGLLWLLPTPRRALIAVAALGAIAWGRDVPTLATVLALVAAPLLARRPATRAARITRTGGYALLCALVPVSIALTRTTHLPAEGALILGAVIAAYAAGALWLTATAKPAALVIGTACGALGGLALYFALPLAIPLPLAALVAAGAPLAAGVLARDREEGALAGLQAGGLGAVVFVALAIPTMLAFPDTIPLAWQGREVIVSDAALHAEVFLLAGPLIGTLFGLIGGALCPGRDSNPHARKGRAF